MSKHTHAALLLGLSFLGIADSWYLAKSALTNTALTCSIEALNGCNTVAQSQYAHLFGIPLGVYGVVFFGLMFVLSALLFVLHKRVVYRGLFILGWVGAAASVCFLLIQFFLIKALCVYCIGSAVIAFLSCASAVWLWKREAPPAVVTIPTL